MRPLEDRARGRQQPQRARDAMLEHLENVELSVLAEAPSATALN